ncbi:hypothetical protein BD309DRAFT_1022685 [Dichomitus squalens]|uniref:Uncharacterized protein n=1 Tax=Dichomitus squalens TaxID=114155 RepID=A0A4Q9PTE0_9APHY|nr:hypothetical protein BD309DRAFT_1022685 [Dichomitus squalens]TBU57713.1 hypothetical protein BD310DRAFT_928550 [Dichomitus squalens]
MADCIAIWATWYTLSRRHANIPKSSISRLLLVDGTVYFLILLVLNSLHLAFTILSLDVDFLLSSSNATNFTYPLSAVLISRFLLHLQSVNLRALDFGSSRALTPSHSSSIVFDRVAGSLGASLAPSDYFGPEDGSVEDGVDGGQDVESAPRE